MDRKRILTAVLAGAALTATAAVAGVTDLIGNLVDPTSAFEGFLGTWTYRDGGSADIDHIIVTDAGSGRVRVQVFGRCENVICNWGTQAARVRVETPQSDKVRSLTADYNLGYALRHVTLHKASGGALSFDIVTEFTDGSDRRDYESMGRLLPPGAIASAAGAAQATNSPAGVAAGPATAPSPAEASAYAASPGAAEGGEEDCIQFNNKKSYVASDGNGGWQIRDFLHPVLKFGPNRNAALAAMPIVSNYRFDEVCYIGRAPGLMTYWRAAGEIPRTPMQPQDCVTVDPAKVQVVQREDSWKVVSGTYEIFDYGDDRALAEQAAQVIRSYRLNRQCFFARADNRTSYWLAL